MSILLSSLIHSKSLTYFSFLKPITYFLFLNSAVSKLSNSESHRAYDSWESSVSLSSSFSCICINYINSLVRCIIADDANMPQIILHPLWKNVYDTVCIMLMFLYEQIFPLATVNSPKYICSGVRHMDI